MVPITRFNWYTNSTLNVANLEPGLLPTSKAMECLLGQFPALKEQGITLCIYTLPTTLRGYAIHPGANTGIARANAVWGPILETPRRFPPRRSGGTWQICP